MKKLLQLKTMLLLCALIVGSGSAWAKTKELSFDLSSNPGGWPTTNSTTLTNYTYTLSEVGYTFALKNVKCNSGYLMMSYPAVLGLPAIEGYKLTKVVAHNSSGCSTSTKVGISSSSSSASYISGGTIQTWSTTSSSYTYDLSSTQANTMYYMYVTNKNAQVVGLDLTYELVVSYTITEQSNNDAWGTVSKSGSVITASPADGYRVSKTNPYTVSPAESATVVQNGNVFTVTPSANTTVMINFEAIPTRTLTMASNDDSYGSATALATSILEEATTTITATPKDGYRFVNWSVEGEGSSVETETATSTTFTMGSEDATVTANFEAIPVWTLSSAVTPAAAGTVSLGATSVREGANTTIEATPNSGYIFKKWSVEGTGASITDVNTASTTFTMGTADATVTAEFAATYTINWSVNGTVIKTENVEENASINFADPASGIPAGYVFQGWVTEANLIDGTTDVDQSANYVTSASSTANITYYAVMATEQGSPFTAHLTGDEIASNFAASPGMAYADSEASYDDTDDGITWGARCSTNTGRHWIQLKSDNDVYIKVAASGNISEVKVKISNASNTSGGVDDITKHGSFSGNVKLDAAQDTNTGTYGSASYSEIVDNILTIEPSKSSSTLYIHTDASARIWNVDITYNSISASNYCTTVNNVIANVSDYGWITFCSDDYALDFTGGVTGLNAYMITGHSGSSVIMSEVTGTVPAKTGLLLKGSKNTSYNIPITTSSSTNVSSNLLKPGTGAAVSAEDGKTKYVLGVNGTLAEFQKIVGTAATVAKGKAYLQFDEEIDARALTFDFDEQTGISETKRETINNNRFYNLNGQQVAQPTKGLYIVNGRKYIVK